MRSKSIAMGALTAAAVFSHLGIAMAAPQKVRIASHVSALSPLHQQSAMFAAEIEKRLPGQFLPRSADEDPLRRNARANKSDQTDTFRRSIIQ